MSKEYFSHDIDALSDIKIVKMMQDYSFSGFGYYWAILAEIYRNGGRYEFEDLGILAKATGIKQENLKPFIDKCITTYTHKNKGLFDSDENGFWSKSLIKRIELREKRSAGKKAKEVIERKELDGIDFVNLTETDYDKLLEKYGEAVLNKAISLLDEWLGKKGTTARQYLGKNHYAHFKVDSWAIQRAKEILGTGNKTNWSI